MCPIYMQGIGQMTPTQQATLRKAQGGMKRSNGSRSRKKKSAKSTSNGTKKRSAGARVARGMKKFVKGSREAKAWMAKIRKLRGKK